MILHIYRYNMDVVDIVLVSLTLLTLLNIQGSVVVAGYTSCRTSDFCSEDSPPKVCDYIIVGAGAAGAVIAARLSENPNVSVCLFEAGIKDTAPEVAPIIETPRLFPQLYPGPITYNHSSVAQPGLNGRSVFLGMGKTLGGSTSHNVMGFYRGFKADYDYWVANGAKGWSYDDVLPYFLKLENNSVPSLKNSPHHSQCGPLQISMDPTLETSPLVQLLKKTTTENGIPEVDCNEPSPFGFCKVQNTIRNGKRESTATAYLRPASGRRNLCITTEALVEKVLITKYQKKAYGIRFFKHGRTYQVKARREVILSGGSFGSVQVLQLSGIGPASLLRKLKIPLISDLPVGYNYHDHVSFMFELLYDLPMSTPEMLNDPGVLSEYILRRTGKYSIPGDSRVVIFFDTVKQRINRPEAQVLFTDSRIPELSTNKRNATTVSIWLSQPKSRGVVEIRNKDPAAEPLIDPKMLHDREDVRTIINVIREIQKLSHSPSMAAVNAKVAPVFTPEQCQTYRPDSDQQWECIIRNTANDNAHPVSTCRMGDPGDRKSVVDTNLRVIGIKGLRVADASIMPAISSTNTMGPAIMIGERAADIIKNNFLPKTH